MEHPTAATVVENIVTKALNMNDSSLSHPIEYHLERVISL